MPLRSARLLALLLCLPGCEDFSSLVGPHDGGGGDLATAAPDLRFPKLDGGARDFAGVDIAGNMNLDMAALPLFGAAQPVAGLTGLCITALATANIDRAIDGGNQSVDLIAASYCQNGLGSQLVPLYNDRNGQGNGTFTPGTKTMLPIDARAIAVADLSLPSPSTSDLAVGCGAADQIAILGGDDIGGFTLKTTIAGPQGGAPLGIAVGQLIGDAQPDVAFTSGGHIFIAPNLQATNAGFGPATPLLANQMIAGRSLVAAELDGAAPTDLASAAPVQTTATAALYLNSANQPGTFNVNTKTLPGGGDGSLVGNGDFDHDGHDDLVVTTAGPDQLNYVLLDGMGGFGELKTTALPAAPIALAVADFDLDGYADVAVLGTDAVYLFLTDPQLIAPVAPVVLPIVSTSNATAIASADFNGDGKPDLAVAAGTNVYVLLNQIQ